MLSNAQCTCKARVWGGGRGEPRVVIKTPLYHENKTILHFRKKNLMFGMCSSWHALQGIQCPVHAPVECMLHYYSSKYRKWDLRNNHRSRNQPQTYIQRINTYIEQTWKDASKTFLVKMFKCFLTRHFYFLLLTLVIWVTKKNKSVSR